MWAVVLVCALDCVASCDVANVLFIISSHSRRCVCVCDSRAAARPRWHYINLPVSCVPLLLSRVPSPQKCAVVLQVVQGPVSFDIPAVWPTYNVVWAVNISLAVLKSPQANEFDQVWRCVHAPLSCAGVDVGKDRGRVHSVAHPRSPCRRYRRRTFASS